MRRQKAARSKAIEVSNGSAVFFRILPELLLACLMLLIMAMVSPAQALQIQFSDLVFGYYAGAAIYERPDPPQPDYPVIGEVYERHVDDVTSLADSYSLTGFGESLTTFFSSSLSPNNVFNLSVSSTYTGDDGNNIYEDVSVANIYIRGSFSVDTKNDKPILLSIEDSFEGYSVGALTMSRFYIWDDPQSWFYYYQEIGSYPGSEQYRYPYPYPYIGELDISVSESILIEANKQYTFYYSLEDDLLLHNEFLPEMSGSLSGSLRLHARPVPEPATMLLLGTGLAVLIGTRLRMKKRA